jgi:hypothetical protein
MFKGNALAGFILAPDVPIECSYSGDGGAQGETMGGCNSKPFQNGYGPYNPGRLSEMLWNSQGGHGYNEAVVSFAAYRDRLPDAIVGVFFGAGDANAEWQARQFHDGFLSHYGRGEWQTPLLRYEGNDRNVWHPDEPFRQVRRSS